MCACCRGAPPPTSVGFLTAGGLRAAAIACVLDKPTEVGAVAKGIRPKTHSASCGRSPDNTHTRTNCPRKPRGKPTRRLRRRTHRGVSRRANRLRNHAARRRTDDRPFSPVLEPFSRRWVAKPRLCDVPHISPLIHLTPAAGAESCYTDRHTRRAYPRPRNPNNRPRPRIPARNLRVARHDAGSRRRLALRRQP